MDKPEWEPKTFFNCQNGICGQVRNPANIPHCLLQFDNPAKLSEEIKRSVHSDRKAGYSPHVTILDGRDGCIIYVRYIGEVKLFDIILDNCDGELPILNTGQCGIPEGHSPGGYNVATS